ncbi:hypothetical protein [Leadbetterella sp. DM7]|uniref:hypothetical protein n=1 Tax=Leadbetterella sp. DM7 TaxID=3235085 RepID=UPI00349E6DBC
MSAIAYIEEGEIRVKAVIFLYGKYADAPLAQAIEAEINRMWNAPEVVIPVRMQLLTVRFRVEVEPVSLEEARQKMQDNRSHEVNFVRVEDANIVERSMMGRGLGQNSGHWLITDQLGQSTTAAHEFGHALGLPHPHQLDYRGTGYPPLMAPRGTLVDAVFQWNPLAEPGAYGGTMNPVHRRVRPEEIMDVLARAEFNGDYFIIGEISNYFYDETGR